MATRHAEPPPPSPVAHGLVTGDVVRYQRTEGGRWYELTVRCLERDGSIGCHDCRGAFRSLLAERLEVKRRGPRGGIVWVQVVPVMEGAR